MTTRQSCALLAGVAAFFALSGAASAVVLNGDPNASRMELKFGALATVKVPRNGTGSASVTVSDTVATALSAEAQIWSTVGFAPGTSLYTGVPFISNLIVTMTNRDLTVSAGNSVVNPVGPGTIVGVTGRAGPASME